MLLHRRKIDIRTNILATSLVFVCFTSAKVVSNARLCKHFNQKYYFFCNIFILKCRFAN